MHWKMLWEIVVFILASASLPFWLQATCERILRRKFGHEFFHSVVNANRLEFPFIREALEEFEVPVDYERFRMQLKCDFLALTYLIESACNAQGRFSEEERLLRMYFRAVLFALAIRHKVGLSE